jgi:hypothetical protein
MGKKKPNCPHCRIRRAPANQDFCDTCRNWMDEADKTPINLKMPRWAWETFSIILETLAESNQTDPAIQREIKHALSTVNDTDR